MARLKNFLKVCHSLEKELFVYDKKLFKSAKSQAFEHRMQIVMPCFQR